MRSLQTRKKQGGGQARRMRMSGTRRKKGRACLAIVYRPKVQMYQVQQKLSRNYKSDTTFPLEYYKTLMSSDTNLQLPSNHILLPFFSRYAPPPSKIYNRQLNMIVGPRLSGHLAHGNGENSVLSYSYYVGPKSTYIQHEVRQGWCSCSYCRTDARACTSNP